MAGRGPAGYGVVMLFWRDSTFARTFTHNYIRSVYTWSPWNIIDVVSGGVLDDQHIYYCTYCTSGAWSRAQIRLAMNTNCVSHSPNLQILCILVSTSLDNVLHHSVHLRLFTFWLPLSLTNDTITCPCVLSLCVFKQHPKN